MKELIQSYYQKMDYLKGNFSQMQEIFSSDMKFHFPGVPMPLTVDQFQEPAMGIYDGFNDFTHSVEEMILEGNKIACRVSITGTHNGMFQGIPASNKSIAVNAITVFKIENNRISEHWVSVDMLGIMQQIGAIEAAA